MKQLLLAMEAPMGIFGQFGKMVRLNKDPDQQQIARLFILAGSSTPKDAVLGAIAKFW